LASGLDQVPIGGAKQAFEAFEVKRQQIFAAMAKVLEGGVSNMPKSTETKS